MKSSTKQQQPKLIAQRFLVKKRISSGSFGVVYLCLDTDTQALVAVKVEKQSEEMSSLSRETTILESLKGLREGVPRLIFFGPDVNANCMALQLLNKDLAHYMKHFKRFTLKCVVNLAEQLITILEQIHKRGVIHRDLKPENVLTSADPEDPTSIYIVDFGVSKYYRDQHGAHIPFRDKKPFIGTTRYASLAAHLGYEIGRKDDLESLGYMLIFLLKGSLPWQNLQHVNEREKTTVVGSMKAKLDSAELCRHLPVEFQRYFDYVKKLNFKQQPEYKYLLQLFSRVAQQHSYQDKKFDWNEGTTIYTESKKSSESAQQQLPSRRDQQQVQSGAGSRLNGSSLLQLPASRKSSRHRSAGNSVSPARSQISSIYINYVASNMSNTPRQFNSKILGVSPENFQDLEEVTRTELEIEDDDGCNLAGKVAALEVTKQSSHKQISRHLKEYLDKN